MKTEKELIEWFGKLEDGEDFVFKLNDVCQVKYFLPWSEEETPTLDISEVKVIGNLEKLTKNDGWIQKQIYNYVYDYLLESDEYKKSFERNSRFHPRI